MREAPRPSQKVYRQRSDPLHASAPSRRRPPHRGANQVEATHLLRAHQAVEFRRQKRAALFAAAHSRSSISCESGRAARPHRHPRACRSPRPTSSPPVRDWRRRAAARWSASWPCAPPAGAPRHGPRPQARAGPLARTLGLPLGLRRPPFLRTASQTAPKDRRSLSPPRRARPTVRARRRRTRRPRSRCRSPRDPRTGVAGRRSSPWDIAPACAATGARPRHACRRKCRNDAPPADRSWRCPGAPCATSRATPPGPRYRSGCDRPPSVIRFSEHAQFARRDPGNQLRDGLTAGMLARAGMSAPAFAFTYKIWKWRLLLPGASEPRLKLLRPQDFRSVFQTALRGLGNRSIVVVGNYEFGPITVEPCRAKARPLRPRRSYFAPVSGISNQWSVGQNV